MGDGRRGGGFRVGEDEVGVWVDGGWKKVKEGVRRRREGIGGRGENESL